MALRGTATGAAFLFVSRMPALLLSLLCLLGSTPEPTAWHEVSGRIVPF